MIFKSVDTKGNIVPYLTLSMKSNQKLRGGCNCLNWIEHIWQTEKDLDFALNEMCNSPNKETMEKYSIIEQDLIYAEKMAGLRT